MAHIALWDHYFCVTCIVFIQQRSQADPERVEAGGGQVCTAHQCAWGQQSKINDMITPGAPAWSLEEPDRQVWSTARRGKSYLRRKYNCQKHFSTDNVTVGISFWILNQSNVLLTTWLRKSSLNISLLDYLISDTQEWQICLFYSRTFLLLKSKHVSPLGTKIVCKRFVWQSIVLLWRHFAKRLAS